MELTPDTKIISVCCIREVVPPANVAGYPYRDIALRYETLTRTLEFPVFTESDFNIELLGRDAGSAELITVVNNVHIYLIRGALPTSDDIRSPVVFEDNNAYVRVLMSEIAEGRCCHVPIHPTVRNLIFPLPKHPRKDIVKDIPRSGYISTERGRLTSSFALVRRESRDGDTHYPLPLIGYHGTSEYFIPDIVGPDGEGLQPTTEKGLYGNNVFYFGNFYKAIRYSFRDSQYATVDEMGNMRSSTKPGGYLRVPSTRFVDPDTKHVVEDLIRDSPALIRFVLFPTKTTRFPTTEPVKVNPAYGTKEAGSGIGLSRKGAPFIRFRNTPTEHPVDPDVLQQKIDASIVGPLFTGKESIDDLNIKDGEPVIPVPVPSSLEHRKKAVLMAYQRIHVATRQPATGAAAASAAAAGAAAAGSEPDMPTSVILLREPNTLPDLADFFLMSSGFLTSTKEGIAGDTINYISEDEIKEFTTEFQDALDGDDSDAARPRPHGNTSSFVDFRILLEDLVSVLPAGSPTLVSCAMMPTESIIRMRNVLSRGGTHRVLVINASRKNDTYPVDGADNSASPHSYTNAERLAIRHLIESTIKTIGNTNGTIVYNPPSSGTLFGKGLVKLYNHSAKTTKVCSIRMEPGTYEHSSGRRIMFDRSIHSPAYLEVYPTGGSYRVYELVRNPATASNDEQKEGLMGILRRDGWDPEHAGSSDTLVIQPFTYESSGGKYKRGRKQVESSVLRSFTQHTEIVITTNSDTSVHKFMPLSWHRGDQRTMYRHHHPMDCGMRVL